MQCPQFENSSALSSSVKSSQWQEGLHDGRSSTAANCTQSLHNDGFQTANLLYGDGMAPPYVPMVNPPLGENQLHAAGRKSTNPFDLPYDSELERSDMFLDMSSLQTTLPNGQLSSTFLGGVSQPWFPQNPATPYIPGTEGGLAVFMSGQAPSSQLSPYQQPHIY
ncbi:hypothetical protein V6Z11_A11G257200 [Gossypium hirsutum]